MKIDYEGLGEVLDKFVLNWPHGGTHDDHMVCCEVAAKEVLTASGLLQRVEELERKLEIAKAFRNKLEAIQEPVPVEISKLVSQHFWEMTDTVIVDPSKAITGEIRLQAGEPLNPEGLRDQTGIENKACKEEQ